MKLNCKGQSSVADALAFFLISSTLALFLLGFANSYGNNFSTQAANEQFRDYASSALKVIMYTSVPRNPQCTLDCCPAIPGNPCVSTDKVPEYDFLLAAVKEDFADDGAMDETAPILRDQIAAIMKPLASTSDYAFYFYSGNPLINPYPYFLWYRTVTPADILNHVKDTLNNSVSCSSGKPGCHIFYYCKPATKNDVDNFLFSIPNINKASSNIILAKAKGINDPPDKIESEVHFALWPSAAIIEQSPGYMLGKLNCCDANQDACRIATFVAIPGGPVGNVTASFIPQPVSLTWNASTTPGQYTDFIGKIRVTNLSTTDYSNVQVSVQAGTGGCNLISELNSTSFVLNAGAPHELTFRVSKSGLRASGTSTACNFDVKVNGTIVDTKSLQISFN
ncbi:MAG: hypothetical protein V1777_04585 [Candidatus Micrarchaeota archaeon]